jgi:adenosylcobyric acid synthase
MSLNSAVTSEGDEISRAQAFQALAAGIEATSDINPILIKPKGQGVSQVVLNGRPWGDVSTSEYYESFVKEVGAPAVKKALMRLSRKYQVIVMEGAGSPAEINLYERDIANFEAADMLDAEAVLVADIERGGVFASIYGTLSLLRPEHKKRVRGIIINKFRGEEKLLRVGIREIQKMVGVPVLGIVPYVEDLRLPEEDSQGLGNYNYRGIDIAVIRLPRISNFTDFDPLSFDRRVRLRFISSSEQLGSPDAIIIPGTKNTVQDLEWLKNRGFGSIRDFKGKIPIIGICGGFQILGKKLLDHGFEMESASAHSGLGLLDVETSFESYDKRTKKASGKIIADRGLFEGLKGAEISGYEIHMGKTKTLNGSKAIFMVNGKEEGAADKDYMTVGTYLHGLFDSPKFRDSFINFIGKNSEKGGALKGVDVSAHWEESISRISEVVKGSIDLSWFYEN